MSRKRHPSQSRRRGDSKEPRGRSSLFSRNTGDVPTSKEQMRKTISMSGTDTFTGDKMFDKAVLRRIFGQTVAVDHKSGPKSLGELQQSHHVEDIESTYTIYIRKDENLEYQSPREKRLIAKYDRKIDKAYERADRKRKSQMRRGKPPEHRSINKHFNDDIKGKIFTPDLKEAKLIKEKKQERIERFKKKKKRR